MLLRAAGRCGEFAGAFGPDSGRRQDTHPGGWLFVAANRQHACHFKQCLYGNQNRYLESDHAMKKILFLSLILYPAYAAWAQTNAISQTTPDHEIGIHA